MKKYKITSSRNFTYVMNSAGSHAFTNNSKLLSSKIISHFYKLSKIVLKLVPCGCRPSFLNCKQNSLFSNYNFPLAELFDIRNTCNLLSPKFANSLTKLKRQVSTQIRSYEVSILGLCSVDRPS